MQVLPRCRPPTPPGEQPVAPEFNPQDPAGHVRVVSPRRYFYAGPVYDLASEELGRKWADDLKRGDVSKEQVTAVLQERFLQTQSEIRNGFREGFVFGYGADGGSVFAQILSHAKQNQAEAGTVEK
jgi:hypothetical protein